MRIFKYKTFQDWAVVEKISDNVLMKAIIEIEAGLYEANLGAGLFKKRMSRPGQGKRGGFRTFIAYKKNKIAIFMYGFAKNSQDNITVKEQEVYKKLAKYFIDITEKQLELLVINNELMEIKE